MAKAQQVTLCPKCRSEIALSDDHCRCGFRFSFPLADGYARPDYIYFQKLKVREDPATWFKSCPHECQIAAMEDAYRTLQYLIGSRPIRDGHMKTLTKIGKNIGKLAQAIETYSQEGGYIEFTDPKPREEDAFETN